ncbi:MAG: PIG-L deacetylase family protein, partial [Promethearchaeota archaeon]
PDIIVTWSQVILPGAGHPDHRYTHSITLDALSYARYRNENHNFPPHRKTVGLYTTYFINDYSTSQPFFVEVTEQFDRIIKVLQVYEEAYGKWPVKEYKISMMSLFGQMSGVKYAEAFNKLLWRCAQSYLY